MEKKYKIILIAIAIGIVLYNLILFYCFKVSGLDPSIKKLFVGVSIPVEIFFYGLAAWFFHKVSKK